MRDLPRLGGCSLPPLAALLACLAACTLAPRYQRPAAPVPGAFPEGSASSTPAAAGPGSDPGWRDVVGDGRLQALVALALERNRDLKAAALNVELVRAQYGIQRAQQLPHFGAAAGVNVQRIPHDLSATGATLDANTWSVGLGLATFELDFFGRTRSLSEAALEQYLATEEAQRSARLTLVSQVANEYYTGLALDEQAALAQSTLSALEESLGLTRRSFEAGRVSEVDLRTGETQVETARFNLAAAQQQSARSANALALLLGGPLPAPETLPPARPLEQQAVTEVPAGVPSEVLARRPDVLAAEHALRAANANIGAARAAFFPSITLTASGGTASASLGGLFSSGSATWSFAPSINVPLFAGGALQAGLEVAEVRTSLEVVRYERALQVAFREVADALSTRAFQGRQVEAQTARVAAEERRFQLSEHRYRSGADSYLTVLTAQRDLFAARQQLIQVRLSRLSNLLELYKALGGGWKER